MGWKAHHTWTSPEGDAGCQAEGGELGDRKWQGPVSLVERTP